MSGNNVDGCQFDYLLDVNGTIQTSPRMLLAPVIFNIQTYTRPMGGDNVAGWQFVYLLALLALVT